MAWVLAGNGKNADFLDRKWARDGVQRFWRASAWRISQEFVTTMFKPFLEQINGLEKARTSFEGWELAESLLGVF